MPRLATVLVLLLATPALLFANSKPHDYREAALERTWAERDARELGEFEAMAASLKDAWQHGGGERYCEVNEGLLHAMGREIDQAKVKADRAARAAMLSRRETMQAATGGAPGVEAIDDTHRDDQTARIRHDEMLRIGTLAGSLSNGIGRGDRGAMKRNLSLAEEFLSVMRRDVETDRR